ncbi:hypothetical protein L2E82_15942 [Cichorium intybus]|uniref:Uncharacterized protein n=1 Tax=Cichorium intybus TaxID=13427 RepID=A0ACB9F5C7_CICIN|nr:hypothetical protein L2E82_15942 [Cichorium intybus]
MSNLEDESAMCVPGDSFVGGDKSSEDLVNQKAVEVIDIEKLVKDLENSSPLAIMDEGLEKYGNDIAIAFRKDIVEFEFDDLLRAASALALIAAGFTYCCSGVYLSLMNIDMTGLFETMTLETCFEGFAGMDNGSKKRPVSTD